jgi:hypothetical protein
VAERRARATKYRSRRRRTDDPDRNLCTRNPPWFNQAAFDEWMRQLQQPWRDEDAWKSET